MGTHVKVISISALIGLLASAITLGCLPYTAGKYINRIEQIEARQQEDHVKIDKAVEDLAYIRAWVEQQKEK